MKNEFDDFQREHVFSLIFIIIKIIRRDLRFLWGILALIFVRDVAKTYIIAGAAVYFLIVIIRAILQYLNFYYRVDTAQNEFQLKQGVINKDVVYLPLQKIQSIELEQNVLEQVLQLYRLKIDSPGSEKDEIEIRALDQEKALALKSLLENSVLIQTDESKHEEKTFAYQVPAKNLFLSALFSNHLRTFFVILGLLGAFYGRISDFLSDDQQEEYWLRAYTEFQTIPWGSIVLVLFILSLSIVVLVTLVRNFVRYFPFQIDFKSQKLQLFFGMFDRKNHSIYPEKIQILREQQNYFERKFHIVNLSISQINEGGISKKSNVFIPSISDAFLQEIYSFLGIKKSAKTFIRPNLRYFISRLYSYTILYVFLGSLSYFMLPESVQKYLVYVWAVIALITFVIQYFQYRNIQLGYTDFQIEKKTGIYNRKKHLSSIENVQSLVIRQKIWHKKRGLADISLNTAGGSIEFKWISLPQLKSQINKWLYYLES